MSLLEEAYAPTVLGALTRARLNPARASGDRPGHTRVRGRSDPDGSEIDRHVPYLPGDDLRRVDWNVHARLGELLTRRFVAEREVPVRILIDASASMGPAAEGSKLDMACAIAALLAHMALGGGDRLHVRAIPGPGRPGQDRIGPFHGRHRSGEVRAFLASLAPRPGAMDLAAEVERALRDAREGLVVLISDFLHPPEAIAGALAAITSRRTEGRLVQVLSREDLEPEWIAGRDTLVDSETGESLHLVPGPETFRQYRQALAAHQHRLRDLASSHGIRLASNVVPGDLRKFLRDELAPLGVALVRS